MDDYQSAMEVFDQMITDMREDKKDGILNLNPNLLIRFLVTSMHVLYKNKDTQLVVDLIESVLYQDAVVKRCNKVALFYLCEYTKWKCDLFELTLHYRKNASQICDYYFDQRSTLKREYLKNLNCMSFNHVEPFPIIKHFKILDEETEDEIYADDDSDKDA